MSKMDIVSRRSWLIAYAPLLLWIGGIFYLSSDNGSMSETSRFIRPILEYLFPNTSEASILIYHGYIRKAAHFSEYAMLAILAVRACVLSTSGLLNRNRYLLPVVLVAVIASADEIGQSFRPSRTGSIGDVLIDVSGGIVMILVLWLIGRPRPFAAPEVPGTVDN